MATETEKRRMSQAMAVACGSVSGQAALARAIGRPEETVSDWANGKSLVDPSLWSTSSASPECRATTCAASSERSDDWGIYKRFYDPPESMSASLRKRPNCCGQRNDAMGQFQTSSITSRRSIFSWQEQ
jgi:hypothetical protein